MLDGTFLSAEFERGARELAATAGKSAFLRCTCPDDVARERILARQRVGHTLSEARPELYDLQKQEVYAGINTNWLAIDTTMAIDLQVQQVLQALRPSQVTGLAVT